MKNHLITYSNFLLLQERKGEIEMDDLKLIMDAAEDRKDLIAFMNQQVWSFAEPGFREYKSAEALIKALEDAGFTVKKD